MVEPGWGEQRARERQAERRLVKQRTLVACLVAAAGIRFIIGFVHGIMGRPQEPAISPLEAGLTVLALVSVGTAMGIKTWRLLDEVQRREALIWLAATGAGAIVVRPLIFIAQPMLRLPAPDMVAWYAAIGIGMVVAFTMWWRRS